MYVQPTAWMRWLTITCVLLFTVITTAQAAHLHRPAGAGHQVQAPLAGTPSADAEEHCPLCVAMHPALPAPMHVAPAPVLLGEPLPSQRQEGVAGSVWAFARFGRPPPAGV
ncbi:MAG TPA: hypothetical protein VKV02_10595 [Acidobacteriaceae bacterium]|nr:hypothetical protein [Acidobacteriaceae bacterium]